jgi:transglutaminase-like putative cysteine protease
VIADTQAPVIEGATDRSYFLGDKISYLEGVTAKDEVDGPVEVYVDNAKVNPEKEGSYEVTYSASDLSGNQATVTVTFTFAKMTATEEKLYAKADEILSSITTDTMSISQKAYEIYNYAYSNIDYTGTSDKSDWENEAYRGMMELNGDCFTYFSVCKILLHRIGVETMDVQRSGGSAAHYWLMVNLGTGWYHFDATRRKEYFDGFMATDAEIADYTNKVGDNFYTYDKTGYPATPVEEFKID